MNAIGGDGFWLIREPGGRVRAIEACGFAGERATIANYRALGFEAIPPRGPMAALTVPGAIGGWTLALELSTRSRRPTAADDVAGKRRAARARRLSGLGLGGALRPDAAIAALIAAPGFAETFLIDGKPAEAGATRQRAAPRRNARPARARRPRRLLSRRRRARDRRRSRAHRLAGDARRSQALSRRVARAAVAAARRRRRSTTRRRRRKGSPR